MLNTRPTITPRKLYNHEDIHLPPILSPLALKNVQMALTHSWAPSTMQGYQLGIQKYVAFCNKENIPEGRRTPAHELVLCAFAAENIGKLSAAVARNRLAAVKAWHIANNWTWNGSDRLSQILRGVSNLAPLPSRRDPRAPVDVRALNILYHSLDRNDHLDSAILACALTAFWGQCRLGELLPTSATPGSHHNTLPSRTSLRLSTKNKAAWVLHIPRTKTSPTGQDVVLVRQRGNLNPISALQHHLLLNIVPRTSPLFTYTISSRVHILSKKVFLERCNQIWTINGLPRFTGHCFRIGGTTELLLSEVSPDIVKTMGRWSSDAFLKYWRSVEDIIPLHAQNLPQRHSPA